MTAVAAHENISQLAEARNQKQHTRLENIRQFSADILFIIDSKSSFVTADIMKETSKKSIVNIQKKLNPLLIEATHHVMWLKGLGNDIPQKELADMLQYIEPETNGAILSAQETINKFIKLQK